MNKLACMFVVVSIVAFNTTSHTPISSEEFDKFMMHSLDTCAWVVGTGLAAEGSIACEDAIIRLNALWCHGNNATIASELTICTHHLMDNWLSKQGIK